MVTKPYGHMRLTSIVSIAKTLLETVLDVADIYEEMGDILCRGELASASYQIKNRLFNLRMRPASHRSRGLRTFGRHSADYDCTVTWTKRLGLKYRLNTRLGMTMLTASCSQSYSVLSRSLS